MCLFIYFIFYIHIYIYGIISHMNHTHIYIYIAPHMFLIYSTHIPDSYVIPVHFICCMFHRNFIEQCSKPLLVDDKLVGGLYYPSYIGDDFIVQERGIPFLTNQDSMNEGFSSKSSSFMGFSLINQPTMTMEPPWN